MTPTEQDLARQLAEHPRWAWMAGMRVCGAIDTVDGSGRVADVLDDGTAELAHGEHIRPQDPAVRVPDLDDPATQGCLLAMLGDVLERVHHRIPSSNPEIPELWTVLYDAADGRRQSVHGATLGEALARALLATWGEA